MYPDAWALTYQFNTRARNEHAQEVRYQLTIEDEVAQKNGWQRHFDKTRPWHSVWKRLVNGEDSWWNRQLGKTKHVTTSASALLGWTTTWARMRRSLHHRHPVLITLGFNAMTWSHCVLRGKHQPSLSHRPNVRPWRFRIPYLPLLPVSATSHAKASTARTSLFARGFRLALAAALIAEVCARPMEFLFINVKFVLRRRMDLQAALY